MVSDRHSMTQVCLGGPVGLLSALQLLKIARMKDKILRSSFCECMGGYLKKGKEYAKLEETNPTFDLMQIML